MTNLDKTYKGGALGKMKKTASILIFCWISFFSYLLSADFPDDKLFKTIENNKEKHISFLQELIKAQGRGEEAVQAQVAARFKELGCEVEILRILPSSLDFKYQFADKKTIPPQKRISVVGKFPGKGDGRSLLLFAHPDSPDIGNTEAWKHAPFAGEIEDNRIYGWGVADDLAGVAIMAEAMAAIRNAGLKPKGDIYLCSTPAKKNAQGVIALLSRGYYADASLYLHPAESGVGMREIKAIASGLLKFRVKIFGKPPPTTEPGKTAFAHLAENPINKAMLLLQALKELDATRNQRVHHPALDKRIGRSTNLLTGYILSGKEGGETQVPGECVFGASISFPPGEKLQQVQKEISACIKGAAQADSWLKQHPPEIEWVFGTQGVEVPVEHPLYQVVSRAIKAVIGEDPYVNPLHTASDIRNPNLFSGIPTLGYGPLGGDLAQNGQHDEWVDVQDYIRAIKVTAKSIMEWGEQPNS